MPIIDTRTLPVRDKLPGWSGQIFHSATMTFAHWDFKAGAAIHAHDHPQEEVWHIVEGEIELTIDGTKHLAGPGMVAIVPPNTTHAVVALTDGKAIVVDYPLRENF
jgi:quercetin dioxygenase-like cupin family protein